MESVKGWMQFPPTAQVTRPHLLATNLITLGGCSSRILSASDELFQSMRDLSQQAFIQAQTGRFSKATKQ